MPVQVRQPKVRMDSRIIMAVIKVLLESEGGVEGC